MVSGVQSANLRDTGVAPIQFKMPNPVRRLDHSRPLANRAPCEVHAVIGPAVSDLLRGRERFAYRLLRLACEVNRKHLHRLGDTLETTQSFTAKLASEISARQVAEHP